MSRVDVKIYGETTARFAWKFEGEATGDPVDMSADALTAHVRHEDALVTTWTVTLDPGDPSIVVGTLEPLKVETLRAYPSNSFKWDLRRTQPDGTVTYPIPESTITLEKAITVG